MYSARPETTAAIDRILQRRVEAAAPECCSTEHVMVSSPPARAISLSGLETTTFLSGAGIPWHQGPAAQIQDPVDRAMTVKQLRSLRTYVQRLCKSRLLKYTNWVPEGKKQGQVVEWSEINMYTISNEIITKLIPFVLKERAEEPASRSWMELVSSGPQSPEVLMSHWVTQPLCSLRICSFTLCSPPMH